MYIDFNKQQLPKVYKKNKRECYLDPIRKRLTYITPEETVRQKIINYLVNVLKVPSKMINSEVPLSHYQKDLKGRADIIIHRLENDFLVPLAVIECKAPNVLIGNKETEQMVGYSNQLSCDYLMISNGESSFCYHYDELTNNYKAIENFPVYLNMLQNKGELLESEPLPPRIAFDKIKDCIAYARKHNEYIDIGENTPINIAVASLNLWECLLDTRVKLAPSKHPMFTLVEDLGIRLLSYGNASGGIFSGPYRSFLIEINGNNQIISIGMSEYGDKSKTVLNVAIDTDKDAHHSLQLAIDDNVKISNDKVSFYHNGRIAVGNIGSGKVSDLRNLVGNLYPKIILGDEFYFGTLVNNKLWTLADKDVIQLIVDLIYYALIRDLYRNELKRS